MTIRIIGVTPPASSIVPNHIEAHLAMVNFIWIDEQSQKRGTTSREMMYDWIVNKQGKAFVQKTDGGTAYVFGAIHDGKFYIRTAENKVWTNELIELQKQVDKPPAAA